MDGMVYLVGAGPGDPDLITVKGWQCLARAEVVISDYLINPALLLSAPAGAEIVELPHHAGAASQEAIVTRMIDAARQGKTVVRLKSGDPGVFGRLGEELAALRAAEVKHEVVPGVTAAAVAAARAGFSLTHAAHASAVAFVTGHQRNDGGATIDYAALAQFPGTLVFYMGMTHAAEWSAALIAHGRAADTPVAVVRRASWPDETLVRCTLGTVAATIEAERLMPPSVIVVGGVVDEMPAVAASRPRLAGVRVLVTRPEGQTAALAHRLRTHGAEVWEQPAIEIGPPGDWQPVDRALRELAQFQWIVFSSANGVRALVKRLWETGGDARRLGAVKLAAIGPGTQAELHKYHLRADLVPDEFRAEALAAALVAAMRNGSGARPRALLIRASRGREVLADQLLAAGVEVEQVVAYASRDVERPQPRIAAGLAAGRVDWITVTSSAIARNLVRLFGMQLRCARLVSISPVTTATLTDLGYPPAAEATAYTLDGVVTAILDAN